jgi:hypothetical protein
MFTIANSVIASNVTNSGVVSCCTSGISSVVSNGGFESGTPIRDADDWTSDNGWSYLYNDAPHSGAQYM